MKRLFFVFGCVLLLVGCTDNTEPNLKINAPAYNTRFQNGETITIIGTVDVPELISSTKCKVYDSDGVSGSIYYNTTVASFDTIINGEKAFIKSFVLNTLDTTTAKIELIASTTDGTTIGKTQTILINQ